MSSSFPNPLPPQIPTFPPHQQHHDHHYRDHHHHHHREYESKSLLYILNPNRHEYSSNDDDNQQESVSNDHYQYVSNFFGTIYQNSVAVYRTSAQKSSCSALNNPYPPIYTPWSTTTTTSGSSSSSKNNPLLDVLNNGYSILYDLMNEHIPIVVNPDQTQHGHAAAPAAAAVDILLFQNQQIISQHRDDDDDREIIQKYISIKTDTGSSNNNINYYYINLYAAYLDGCSIVINHADLLHPYIANLCTDLQLSFPHVYANIYITPITLPKTVTAHADDRDVLIIQVLGCKLWTIYTNIPIPYPYPNEQVGKVSSLPVPEHVLKGPILFQSILQPGDILYIPRGYVHEAQCVTTTTSSSSSLPESSSPIFGSFHITIAIPTHDWSLLGIVQNMTTNLLSSSSMDIINNNTLPIDYRKAIDRSFGQTLPISSSSSTATVAAEPSTTITPSTSNTVTTTITESSISDPTTANAIQQPEQIVLLQQQIDIILQLFKREITVSNINEILYQKYNFHNQRAIQQRTNMIQQYTRIQKQQQQKQQQENVAIMVGYEASRAMTLQTCIRAVTDAEKEMIMTTTLPQQHQQKHKPGLHVCDEIYNDIMIILQHVKSTPNKSYPVYQLRSLLSLGVISDTIMEVDVDSPSSNGISTMHTTPPLISNNSATTTTSRNMICDMTLLSFARRCVEFGAFTISCNPE